MSVHFGHAAWSHNNTQSDWILLVDDIDYNPIIDIMHCVYILYYYYAIKLNFTNINILINIKL